MREKNLDVRTPISFFFRWSEPNPEQSLIVTDRASIMEAANFILVARPLRGGKGKGWATKNFLFFLIFYFVSNMK